MLPETFIQQLEEFVAAGNTYSGLPKNVAGKVIIDGAKPGSHITFGEDCLLVSAVIRMPHGGGELHIGKKTTFRGTISVGPGSRITIGDRNYFNRPCALRAWEGATIDIGSDCLFSNAAISTSDMHAIFKADTKNRINPSRSIVIGDRVWICENVKIRKGARIGDDCVIGADSAVSRPIRSGTLAVGSPAVAIRTGITWSPAQHATSALPAKDYPKIQTEKPSMARRFFKKLGFKA